MSSDRSLRVVRGTVAAAFATFVALLSHVVGGAELPGAIGVVAPLVLSTAACVLLAGRRLSLVRLSLSVAVSQLLFHTLFVLGTTHPAAAASGSGLHAAHLAPVRLDVATTLAHDAHAGQSMWLAHVSAGLVTVAVLHRAESLLRGLSRLMALLLERLLPAPLRPATPSRAPRATAQPTAPAPRPLGFHPETTGLRGPPVVALH